MIQKLTDYNLQSYKFNNLQSSKYLQISLLLITRLFLQTQHLLAGICASYKIGRKAMCAVPKSYDKIQWF